MSGRDVLTLLVAVLVVWLLFKGCDAVIEWADGKIRRAMHDDRLRRRRDKGDT